MGSTPEIPASCEAGLGSPPAHPITKGQMPITREEAALLTLATIAHKAIAAFTGSLTLRSVTRGACCASVLTPMTARCGEASTLTTFRDSSLSMTGNWSYPPSCGWPLRATYPRMGAPGREPTSVAGIEALGLLWTPESPSTPRRPGLRNPLRRPKPLHTLPTDTEPLRNAVGSLCAVSKSGWTGQWSSGSGYDGRAPSTMWGELWPTNSWNNCSR